MNKKLNPKQAFNKGSLEFFQKYCTEYGTETGPGLYTFPWSRSPWQYAKISGNRYAISIKPEFAF